MNLNSNIRNRLRYYWHLHVPGSLRTTLRNARGRYCYSEQNNSTSSIFIHIPKTAGSSVSEALFSDMRSAHAHFTAQDYFDESADKYNDFFKFAFVRHPIDRFVSAYRHLLSPPEWVHSDTRAFAEQYVIPSAEINEFVRHFDKEPFIRGWIHFKSQTRFLLVNGNIDMDFVGRFENLEADIRRVARLLNADEGLTMPHVNRSKRMRSKDMKLTRESIGLLTEYYSEDFENFGYERSSAFRSAGSMR